ncbi:type II toxin-antitoxin system VapB family antitoxin [Pantoea sp. B65]|uniref:type II toxin-antitoxin system VapB family antitoxin n=1 Tax=Pantoea sp. B65 TaxID=2813359 RepID=UPI0039B6A76A
MSRGSVFTSNRTQNVRIPANVRFPDSVKSVIVRVSGKERILTPAKSGWDSFFHAADSVSDDFMPERASQQQVICILPGMPEARD